MPDLSPITVERTHLEKLKLAADVILGDRGRPGSRADCVPGPCPALTTRTPRGERAEILSCRLAGTAGRWPLISRPGGGAARATGRPA